jgi:hypothetical protein
MSPEAEGTQSHAYVKLLHQAMIFLAALVVARFVLEVAGVSSGTTRFLSSTAGLFLVAIFLAAVAPLRGGLRKFYQLPVPSILLSAWTAGWIIVATIISAVLRLERSHFAEKSDFGNWSNLGRHVLGHLIEIVVFFVIVLIVMAATHVLWRWPITVGPGAMLGGFVIMRYWVEAMGLAQWRAAAWSSTILVLLSAFYLGGLGPRLGLSSARQLLAPALVLGWTWRVWVYIATLLSALVPFFKTHFFDPSRGNIPVRLLQALGGAVVEGFLAGLIVWGIAVWISRATRPSAAS